MTVQNLIEDRRMTSTGIVTRTMRRTDGAYGLVVRLEARGVPEVYVRSDVELPEGKRVSVEGAGKLWRLR